MSAIVLSGPGPVEICGRGSNRMIDDCQRCGVKPPGFEEQPGNLILTFAMTIAGKPTSRGRAIGRPPTGESLLRTE